MSKKQYANAWRNTLSAMHESGIPIIHTEKGYFLAGERVDPRAFDALHSRGYLAPGAFGKSFAYGLSDVGREVAGSMRRPYNRNGSSAPAQPASQPAEDVTSTKDIAAAVTALTGAINAQNRRLDMVAARLGMVLDAINGHGNAAESWLENAVNEAGAQQMLTRRTNELLSRLVAAWEGEE